MISKEIISPFQIIGFAHPKERGDSEEEMEQGFCEADEKRTQKGKVVWRYSIKRAYIKRGILTFKF